MPADYLSRIPGTKTQEISEVTEAFDPFQTDLHELQKQDAQLQNMNHFRVHKKWLTQILKKEANYLQNLAPKLFQDHNKIIWVNFLTTNTQEQRFTYLKNTENWPSVKRTTINLVVTMLL